MFRLVTILVLFGLSCLHTSLGYTFTDSVTIEETEYGTMTKYCSYEGMKFGIGSKFKDMERCVKCSCTRSSLSCSSLTGSVHLQGEEENTKCKNVVAGCRNRWVLKKKQTKKCPKRLIPEHGMSGK